MTWLNYHQAPTYLWKLYEKPVIESEARTAAVQLKSKAYLSTVTGFRFITYFPSKKQEHTSVVKFPVAILRPMVKIELLFQVSLQKGL